MMEVNEKLESYYEGFKSISKTSNYLSFDWIKDVRTKAIERFIDIGFPDLRQEDWRFTNLAPVIKANYKLRKTNDYINGNLEISSLLISDLQYSLVVFVNGEFAPGLSRLVPNSGILIKPLSRALQEDDQLIREHLFQYSSFENESFTALNTALFDEGVFVYVPDNTAVDELIHVLYISADNGEPYLQNPRNLFVIGDNSSAHIIEHYYSSGDEKYFSNTVTEVSLGENSVLDHYFIEAESNSAFNISSLDVYQKSNSSLNSHSILLGGSIVRNNIHPVLAGEGCNSSINGLFMSRGTQHMDNYMKVEHVSPHCDSRQLYNGILADRSKGVFHGRIIVHKDAQKTDAKQTNRNLLLSDNARIDTKPQLEIYADDVKCTHGATIGQMDKDAVFYLRSRGIEADKAKSILLEAFARQNIDNIRVSEIKEYIEKLIKQWFEKVGMGT